LEVSVVLKRSCKLGLRRVALALPAGYSEADEMPEDAARRELREETGYTSDDWGSLGSSTVDRYYGVGTAHMFLARSARQLAMQVAVATTISRRMRC
jgi:ADP-ribose pyrophosphatase